MSDPQLLMAFYGDDFSGSTDAMESLALAGIRTILFLQAPSIETLQKYQGIQAVGLAGVSRTMTPQQMNEELPSALAALGRLGPPLVHYKVCSTFDSSPRSGSIGRAIDIGRAHYGSQVVPLVVGAPVLERYCVFGNLFARSGLDSPVYRLDRHPTMSRHPTTPMHESDLRLVLAEQTDCRVGLVDLSHLQQGLAACRNQLDQLVREGVDVVLFDTVDGGHLACIGQLIWEMTTQTKHQSAQHSMAMPSFVVGSSGVEYALTSYWRSSGMVTREAKASSVAPAARIAVVSGSCSPVTQRQIEYALDRGFAEVPVDPTGWIDEERSASTSATVLQAALGLLKADKSVIIHTSCGPDDPRIDAVRDALRARQIQASSASLLGTGLGSILRKLIQQAGLRRVAVTGGDTAGYVAKCLDVEGLELVAPVAPGSPLCHIHAARGSAMSGMEIAFKGGQVGRADYLVRVRDGVTI